MISLIGKIVIVEAGGMTYRGKLIEIGEEEVYLLGERGYIVIPTKNISSIREAK